MRSSILAGFMVVGLLGVANPGFAWEHTTFVWESEDLPVMVVPADDGAPNSIAACEQSNGLSGCCEETVPQGFCLESVEHGFEAWREARCADFEYDVIDTISNPEEAFPNTLTFSSDDGISTITFNDPEDIIPDGVLARTRSTAKPGTSTIVASRRYSVVRDSDIGFNDDVVFTTDEAIADGNCVAAYSMKGIATHEIGHLWGMDHSCDNPDEGFPPCLDIDLQEASMFWASPPCDLSASTINVDDIEGVTVLYGPSARFQCSRQLAEGQSVGVVPFRINCAVVSEFLNEVTDASWRWGDGGADEGLTVSHEYTEPGNYSIEVRVRGEREACGPDGWTNRFRRVGYVRACGEPQAAFEVSQIDGLRYELLNTSDVSIYGCLSDIQWDIFEGTDDTGERVGEPISAWAPEIELPRPGTYTVFLSLGGIGGAGGAKATFDASRSGGERRGFGCNTGPLPPRGAALGLVVVGWLGRRSRRARPSRGPRAQRTRSANTSSPSNVVPGTEAGDPCSQNRSSERLVVGSNTNR